MNNKYFAKVFADRSVLVHFAVLAALAAAVLISFGIAVDSYQQAQATKEKIISIRQAAEQYAQKKALLDKEPARPISESQVDDVQTAVLVQLQHHKLELSKMSAPAQKGKEKDRIYEMELRGSYDNTMEFLSSFRQKAKALISVLSVSFQPDKDMIRTSVKYKVYVR